MEFKSKSRTKSRTFSNTYGNANVLSIRERDRDRDRDRDRPTDRNEIDPVLIEPSNGSIRVQFHENIYEDEDQDQQEQEQYAIEPYRNSNPHRTVDYDRDMQPANERERPPNRNHLRANSGIHDVAVAYDDIKVPEHEHEHEHEHANQIHNPFPVLN
jgi:hypothetical protein